MRHGLGLIAVIAAAWTALPARAQEPAVQHWPLREISFPVAIEQIEAMNPKPSKVRLYVARGRGRFEQVAESALADLDVFDTDKNRRGFRYRSPEDGEYSFSIQLVYPDGDVNPRDADITAHRRVVIDTRPPQVRAAAVGTLGLEWDVVEENPKANSVELEVRWAGQQRYTSYTPRSFALRDRYTISGPNAPTASQRLEVRVVAYDRAGHKGSSAPIILPSGGSGTGLGGDAARPASDRTGFGNPDDFQVSPEISYVRSHNLTIESKLTRITRSGVRAAHLWVNDGKGGWQLAKSQPEKIAASDRDPTIRIPHTVEKDGLYGFIVIPENGAGGKQDDPRTGDPAQFLIEVDTDKPFIQVTGHRVSPGGTAGPRVEIEWDARDKNFFDDPIVLEYATEKTGPWKPITPGKLRNSGRYTWEVDDKDLWKVYVRASAVDKASNRSEHVYEKEILIDLEKPAAMIERVEGAGGPTSKERDSHRPSVEPSSSPPPAPVTPTQPRTEPPKPKAEPPQPKTEPAAPTAPMTVPSVPPPVPSTPSGGPAVPALPAEIPSLPGKI